MHTTTENRIRLLREARGLKPAHLAVEFDVHPNTVGYWETIGPPRKMMPQLARYFDVSVEHLMGWDEREAA